MKQIVYAVGLMIVIGFAKPIDIPPLPNFPDVDFTPLENTFGTEAINPVKAAYVDAQGQVASINSKMQKMGPVLETFGTEGTVIIHGLGKLAVTMTTTDFSSPLSVCWMAKDAYPVVDAAVKSMESAESLGIPGLNEMLGPMRLFRVSLGFIRCPVAFWECITG